MAQDSIITTQEISVRELAMNLHNGQPLTLIDVRQPWEHQLARLPDSTLIPLNELPQRAHEIPVEPGKLIVIYCHHGVRSLSAVRYLQRVGVQQVVSLAGGIDAWSCEVDPTVPRY
jgi:rhodanese-related sulfurtransferase